jgi:toxin ParE1/3/4
MAQIIWTEPALTDLNEIAEYIALDKVEAARRLVEQVFKSVGQLEQFPELGRKPPELEASIYREIIVNPCRILYRLDQNKAYILYVMRGERQLRNYLLDDRAQNIS